MHVQLGIIQRQAMDWNVDSFVQLANLHKLALGFKEVSESQLAKETGKENNVP